MSENAPQNANPAALSGLRVVTHGNVVNTFMSEVTGLVREIAQHRALAEDLRAWFDAHPDLSERFGAFQQARAKARKERVSQKKPSARGRRR